MPDETTTTTDPLEELEQEEATEVAEREAAADAHVPAAREAAADSGEEAAGGAEAPDQPLEEQAPWELHGFASAEEMAEAYGNVNTLRGRLANELGSMRQEMARLSGPPQQAQPETDDPLGMPQLSEEQLYELFDTDPIQAMAYIAASTSAQMAAMQQEQMKPLYKDVNDAMAARTVDQLKAEFGDQTIHEHKAKIAERLTADPGYFEDPQLRYARLREVVQAAEYERSKSAGSQRPTQQRQVNGQFAPGPANTAHVEGGSTPAPSARQGELDPIIEEIEAVEHRGDAFGQMPPLNPRT